MSWQIAWAWTDLPVPAVAGLARLCHALRWPMLPLAALPGRRCAPLLLAILGQPGAGMLQTGQETGVQQESGVALRQGRSPSREATLNELDRSHPLRVAIRLLKVALSSRTGG